MELTKKQKYQRDYYRKNKEKICAHKREQYEPAAGLKTPAKPKRKTRKTSPANMAKPAKATSPVKEVDKMLKKTRHKIEDLLLAQELGSSIDEL
ncbi:MAG: hypothetical protein AAGJ78_04690 [Pseudomonadota bacterium]